MKKLATSLSTLAIVAVLATTAVASFAHNDKHKPPKPSFVKKSAAGWASATGFRNATTTVQKAIVAKALAASGRKSGQSIATPTQGWLTDAAGGDGTRMKNAANRYINWLAAPRGTSLSTLKTQIIGDFAGSSYSPSQKQAFANRITSMYGPFIQMVRNDNEALSFIGVQKQCLEWAMTLAISANGRAKGYGSAGVTDLTTIRPGMGLYKTDSTHAMIIVDIYWDSTGKPAKFRVAEANWASDWSNPTGQVPWERTIKTNRDTVTISGHKVINYES